MSRLEPIVTQERIQLWILSTWPGRLGIHTKARPKAKAGPVDTDFFLTPLYLISYPASSQSISAAPQVLSCILHRGMEQCVAEQGGTVS